MTAKPEYDMKVTEKERRLIDFWRKVEYGKIEVHVENGQPVRIVEARKNIKL